MKFEDNYHRATEAEIAELIALPGAPHVTFGCSHCGMVNWSAKNLALSPTGHYTGARNIFVIDWAKGECSCPASGLVCVTTD